MWRPVPGEDDRFYFEAWQEGRLLAQRCGGCGRLRHPPGPSCPHCCDPRWDPVALSGGGEVYSYVIPRKPALEGMLPSPVIALIALDEGVRVVANLVGVDPEDVAFGQRVSLEFREVDDGYRIPVFRPV